jgi:hypothetical protein
MAQPGDELGDPAGVDIVGPGMLLHQAFASLSRSIDVNLSSTTRQCARRSFTIAQRLVPANPWDQAAGQAATINTSSVRRSVSTF